MTCYREAGGNQWPRRRILAGNRNIEELASCPFAA
jgi:hypothetical protein